MEERFSKEKKRKAEVILKNCLVVIIKNKSVEQEEESEAAGMGVLIEKNCVLTCAHVISNALGRAIQNMKKPTKTDVIHLQFPYSEDNKIYLGKIDFWRFEEGKKLVQNDIATVILSDNAPKGMKCENLIISKGLAGYQFCTYGATESHSSGVAVYGIIDKQDFYTGLTMLISDTKHPFKINEGFSGSPVWSPDMNGVVGIIKKYELGKNISSMIPSKAIKKIWPDLPIMIPTPEIIKDYTGRFIDNLNRGDSNYPKPETPFSLTFKAEESIQNVKNLIDWMKKQKPSVEQLILFGAAGGGKSYVVGNISRILVENKLSEDVPILLNFKRWIDVYSEELVSIRENPELSKDLSTNMDLLLKVSVHTKLNTQNLIDILIHRNIIIIADGLNEVHSDVARNYILDVLDDFYRKVSCGKKVYIIVTERSQYPDRKYNWIHIELNKLNTEESRRCIKHFLKDDDYDNLSESNKKLLGLPFLMDLAIKRGSSKFESQTEAINKYLMDIVKLEKEDIKLLSKAAFDVYQIEKSATFDKINFSNIAGETLTEKSIKAGLLTTSEKKKLNFYHQLVHDYFAAQYLASVAQIGDIKKKNLWNQETFDAITFNSSSADALHMAIEQLTDQIDSGDSLIERVYDWNWPIGVKCVGSAVKQPKRKCSIEMETAILSLVSAKRFDRILYTRAQSESLLKNIPDEIANKYFNATSVDDLIEMASQVESDKKWFKLWKKLFFRKPDQGVLTQSEIKFILHKHSVVGWCAANTFCRFENLIDENLVQLHSYYEASQKDAPHENAVRWRIVHVMVASPIKKSVDFLIDVIKKDSYQWAKSGAGRSLFDIAARVKDKAFQKYIISNLIDVSKYMKSFALMSVAGAAFVEKCPQSWIKNVTPILEKFRDLHKTTSEKMILDVIIEDFQSGDWKMNFVRDTNL